MRGLTDTHRHTHTAQLQLHCILVPGLCAFVHVCPCFYTTENTYLVFLLELVVIIYDNVGTMNTVTKFISASAYLKRNQLVFNKHHLLTNV